MKVKELIKKLEEMPEDADIIISVDDDSTTETERIFSTPQIVQENDATSVSILCYE